MSLSIPANLSFSRTLSSQTPLFLSLHTSHTPRKSTIIRMGGGPRTYPGGVSKWQWKRMQAKKAKQLLKARLCRERQIYEMRKRAELKAAVSELERPWEVVERAPTLFSVSADEQVKVLADRFQKPGGFDLWSDRDGPELFQTPDGIPSARFFPKGVVHSIKPYGKINGTSDLDNQGEDLGSGNENEKSYGHKSNGMSVNEKYRRRDLHTELKDVEDSSDSENGYSKDSSGKWSVNMKSRKTNVGELRNQGSRSTFRSGLGSGHDKGNSYGHMSNGMSVNEKYRRRGLHTELNDVEDSSDSESGYSKDSSGKWSVNMKSRKTNVGELRNQGSRSTFRSGLGSGHEKGNSYGHMSNGMSVNEKYRRHGLHTEQKEVEDSSDSESGYSKDSSRKWVVDKKSRRNVGELTKQGNRSRFKNFLGSFDSGQVGSDRKERGSDDGKIDGGVNRRVGLRSSRYSKFEVLDMSLQQDRSYGFQAKNRHFGSNCRAPKTSESF